MSGLALQVSGLALQVSGLALQVSGLALQMSGMALQQDCPSRCQDWHCTCTGGVRIWLCFLQEWFCFLHWGRQNSALQSSLMASHGCQNSALQSSVFVLAWMLSEFGFAIVRNGILRVVGIRPTVAIVWIFTCTEVVRIRFCKHQ